MNEIDAYGVLDVMLEDWSNFDIVNYDRTINGSTLNNILRSQFILFSGSSDLKLSIPGGHDAWSEITECIFVVLRSFCEVDHIMRRVFVLVLKSSLLKSIETARSMSDMALGAITFIKIWISHFKNFVSDSDVVRMKMLVEEFIAFLVHSNFMNPTPTGMVELALVDLSQLLQNLCCLETMSSKTNQPIKQLFVTGSWDNSSEQKCLELRERKKAKDLKRQEAIKAREKDKSQPTIAIFGITQDMLNDDDSDESAPPLLPPEDEDDDGSETGNLPEPRVHIDFQLLQDPTPLDVWSFDAVELARQWTLLDHNLFSDIPLDGLYECSWTEPRLTSRATEVRRFIDRFNAVSCWVTESILSVPTPDKRGELYDKYVDVAVHLESLNNFNGVIAILTGLQQGCITRLNSTLMHVSLSAQKSLKRLQALMSAPKNYQQYREAMTIRIAVLGREVEDWRGLDNAASARPAGSSQLKRVSTISAAHDTTGAGVVPHLGAHLAELVGIEEGNPTYVPNAPHLFNIEKKRLCSRVLLLLRRVQRVQYALHPLPLLQLVLTREFGKGRRLSAAQSTEWSRRMFNISLKLEGKDGMSTQPGSLLRTSVPKASSAVSINTQEKTFTTASAGVPRDGLTSPHDQRHTKLSAVVEDISTASDTTTGSDDGSTHPLHPKKKFFSFRRKKNEKPAPAPPDSGKADRQILLGSKSEYLKKTENRKKYL